MPEDSVDRASVASRDAKDVAKPRSPAPAGGPSSEPQDATGLLSLQRLVGNQAVLGMLKPPPPPAAAPQRLSKPIPPTVAPQLAGPADAKVARTTRPRHDPHAPPVSDIFFRGASGPAGAEAPVVRRHKLPMEHKAEAHPDPSVQAEHRRQATGPSPLGPAGKEIVGRPTSSSAPTFGSDTDTDALSALEAKYTRPPKKGPPKATFGGGGGPSDLGPGYDSLDLFSGVRRPPAGPRPGPKPPVSGGGAPALPVTASVSSPSPSLSPSSPSPLAPPSPSRAPRPSTKTAEVRTPAPTVAPTPPTEMFFIPGDEGIEEDREEYEAIVSQGVLGPDRDPRLDDLVYDAEVSGPGPSASALPTVIGSASTPKVGPTLKDLKTELKDVASAGKAVAKDFQHAPAESKSSAPSGDTGGRRPIGLPPAVLKDLNGTELTVQKTIAIVSQLGKEFLVELLTEAGVEGVADLLAPVVGPAFKALKETWNISELGTKFENLSLLAEQDLTGQPELSEIVALLVKSTEAETAVVEWTRNARVVGIGSQLALTAAGVPIPGLPTLLANVFKLAATIKYFEATTGGKEGRTKLKDQPRVAAPGLQEAKKARVLNPPQVRTELHQLESNRIDFQAWTASQKDPGRFRRFYEAFDLKFGTKFSVRGADKIEFDKFQKMKAQLAKATGRPVDDLLVEDA